MQISVSQIAAYIITQITSLESTRRKLFLNWLFAHSNQVTNGSDLNRIQDSLVDWFESLSEADVLREYYLVTGEVRWWRNQEDETLAMMLDESDTCSSWIADDHFFQPARS
jgi:hypothetical protein